MITLNVNIQSIIVLSNVHATQDEESKRSDDDIVSTITPGYQSTSRNIHPRLQLQQRLPRDDLSLERQDQIESSRLTIGGHATKQR